MMAPGPAPPTDGQRSLARFRHLSRLLGFNMAGCLAADRRGRGGGDTGGRQKQTQQTQREKYNMLVNKRIRCMGMERLLFY